MDWERIQEGGCSALAGAAAHDLYRGTGTFTNELILNGMTPPVNTFGGRGYEPETNATNRN